jgi:transcriptional regulator with XRE-family HTH domain
MRHSGEEALSRVIRQTRAQRGLSRAELGQRAGLPAGRLAGIERGERVIRWSDLVAIAYALRTTPSALVARAERQG